MTKLSRTILAAVAVTIPALIATPAAAAPAPEPTVAVLPAAPSSADGMCRFFPTMCKGAPGSLGELDGRLTK